MSKIGAIRLRAGVYEKVRQFFSENDVLEVETPLFSRSGNTDPYIHSLVANFSSSPLVTETFYAQTSPEFAMKRLIANGSGSIYQICKAFRVGELGRLHNPEFSMLEWYRVDYSYHELMDEIDALLAKVGGLAKAQRISYGDLFFQYLDIDIHVVGIAQLKHCAIRQGIAVSGLDDNIDDWLNLLLSHVIEPHLGRDVPTFVYDYPASQAALASVREDKQPVAERFELYINGIEIANGYQELTDGAVYRERFLNENKIRCKRGMNEIMIQDELLSDFDAGLPFCSGVALGLDRLLMVLQGKQRISDVLTFDHGDA